MASSITAADVALVLAVPGVINPTQLKEFSADNIFAVDAVARKETAMGVDGVLTAGLIKVPKEMGITLMADSISAAVFDAWDGAEQANMTVYYAMATVRYPAIGRVYSCVRGALKNMNIMPSAGKVLKERAYAITWQDITWQPI